MTISVLLFAGVREAAGSDRVTIELPDGATYTELLTALEREIPTASAAIASSRLAVGGAFVAAESPIETGGEVALIPPVSGG